MPNENEIPMKKYFYRKVSNQAYNIWHKNDVKGKQTWIASTDTAEKADFLCKAANSFNPNAVTTVVTVYP